MLEPVQWAESSIKPAVPDGRPLCAEFRKLAAKFPFTASPNAPPAHLEEIKAFFQPGEGLLSRFADQRLAGLVVRQGSRYIPDPQTAAQVNPEFLEFLNRGAEIGRALCQGASPSFQYTLRAYPNPVIASFRLAIDGRVLTVPGNEGPLQFVWPGAQQQEGLLTTSGFEVAGQRGLWGVFHLFYEATRVEVSGPVTRFEWNLRRADGGEMKRPDGTPLTIRAEVDAGGGPPVFKRDYLTTLRCVSRIGN
jgi:type VI protein secretion system component VasK